MIVIMLKSEKSFLILVVHINWASWCKIFDDIYMGTLQESDLF